MNGSPSITGRSPHSQDAAPHDELNELLLLCAHGSRSALHELYQRTVPRLRALALRITRDRMLADDVLHDVFVRLMKDAGRFDRERGSAAAFLTMLTRFKAMDLMRERRREPVFDAVADEAAVTEEAILTSLRRADGLQLAQCLARLAAEQRRLIILAVAEGRTHHELAKQLSIPLGTVKSAIRRGLIALRRCLDQ